MSTFNGLQCFMFHIAILTICVDVLWFTTFNVACRYTDDMCRPFVVYNVSVACRYNDDMCQRFVFDNVFVAYRYTYDVCQRLVVYNVLCCMSLY